MTLQQATDTLFNSYKDLFILSAIVVLKNRLLNLGIELSDQEILDNTSCVLKDNKELIINYKDNVLGIMQYKIGMAATTMGFNIEINEIFEE